MIVELAELVGVKNLRFTLKELPLQTVGFISFTSSDDQEVEAEFEVSEERYRVADNYKIGFKPTVTDDGVALAPSAYYISDLESLIRQGYAGVRVVAVDSIA